MITKTIAIIGAGAIGRLWAHALSKLGHNVSLIGRSPITAANQLNVISLASHAEHTEVSFLDKQLPKAPDLVLVTTKAYQVKEAITPFLAQLTHCPIVLMHNGMGAADTLELANSNNIFLATTSQAALIKENICHHTGQGTTMIGCYQQASERQGVAIAKLLDQALPPVDYVTDIQAALWKKLTINCVINPLTALHDCRNGALAHAKFSQQIDCIVKEISLLTDALAINLDYTTLRHLVNGVIEKTANNYSSMHQDVCYARPTEIDYINGFIVKQAQSHNISVPENERLWQAIIMKG